MKKEKLLNYSIFLLFLTFVMSCSKDDKLTEIPSKKTTIGQARLSDFTKDVYPCAYPLKGLRCIARGQDCRWTGDCKGRNILTLEEIRMFFPQVSSWEEWINYGRITNKSFFKYMEDRGYCEPGTFRLN